MDLKILFIVVLLYTVYFLERRRIIERIIDSIEHRFENENEDTEEYYSEEELIEMRNTLIGFNKELYKKELERKLYSKFREDFQEACPESLKEIEEEIARVEKMGNEDEQ